jgi:hypothetical protein
MKKSSNLLIRHGDMGPCMSEPKTREEILQERLREIEGRLTKVKQRIGTSANDFTEKLERAEKRRKTSRGEARFVKVGGTMVEATDRLEALLVMEECYEALLDLEGKDPVKEAEGLIQRKIKILKELLPAS